MKFVQFPNGKVWRVGNNGWIEGSVLVPDYENLDSLESRLDAIAEAATGSCCGLTDFAYQFRGNDIVSFQGCAEELPDDEADYVKADFKVLDANSGELVDALVAQYGMLPMEAKHALDNLENNYGEECALDILGSQRQIRSPAHPEECNYVRVVVDGLEIAYWCDDEWRDDPAMCGTRGRRRRLLSKMAACSREAFRPSN